MNLKKLISLTFSAVSLVSIPSIVCSCGNQYQPDYTIRCDTKEITWSLSQTTETEETSPCYTIDKKQIGGIGTEDGAFNAYLHKEKDGPSLGKNIAPHFDVYKKTLWFTDLEQTAIIRNYWLKVTGLVYRDSLNIFSRNNLWFQFNVIE